MALNLPAILSKTELWIIHIKDIILKYSLFFFFFSMQKTHFFSAMQIIPLLETAGQC